MAHRDLLAEDSARSERAAGVRALVEKRSSFSQPTAETLIALGATPTASGARVSEQTALTVETVMSCVSIRSDMMGIVPLKMYRKTALNSREEVSAKEKPAARLTRGSPDGHRTQFEFRKFLSVGFDLGGNGYGRVHRDSFYQPGEIEPLLPCDVRVEKVKVRGRSQILYFVDGERTPLTRADVFHIPGFSTNGYTGLSPIRAARESIGMAITQRDAAGRAFQNGAQIGMYLATDQQRSPEQMKAAKAEWEKEYSGGHNTGKTPLFANGWKLNAIQGMTLADAEFLASRKYTDSQIAKLYRVPEVILGSSEKASAWGTGIETLMQGFLSFTLDPCLTCWEQAADITLLSEQDRLDGYYFKFNRKAILQANLADQAAWIDAMRRNAIQNVNEIRATQDLNDIADAIGDRYDLPLNNQGGVAAGNAKPVPAGAGTEDES